MSYHKPNMLLAFVIVGTIMTVAAALRFMPFSSESHAQVTNVMIGRYQIVNDTKNDGVFWVDTASGRVEQCQWANQKWICFRVRE